MSNPITTYINKEVQIKDPKKYGYTFDGWSGEDLTGNPQTFTIPQGKRKDLNYVANFTPISGKLTFRFIYQGATGPSGEWFVDKDNIQNFSGGQE